MGLKQQKNRIVGKIRFVCPLCDKEFIARDVALPGGNIILGETELEVVVIGDKESPDGISLYVQASQECRNCKIAVKQFFPIDREDN